MSVMTRYIACFIFVLYISTASLIVFVFCMLALATFLVNLIANTKKYENNTITSA